MTEKRPGELTAKQKKALMALIHTATQREAATAAGISESTLIRYLKNPVFIAEYERMTNELLSTALHGAEKSVQLAFTTLSEVCGNCDENGQTRVSAARALIEYTLRLKEVCEFERRLEELERRIEE